MAKLTILDHLCAEMEAMKNYIATLLVKMIEAVDEQKADKLSFTDATLKTTGWVADTDYVAYPYCYTLSDSAVTVADRVDILIDPDSMDVAAACGICPITTTSAGKIYVRATNIPTAAIEINYSILQGGN